MSFNDVDGRGTPTPEAVADARSKSGYFWEIATDARGVIRAFSAGAERMLGYAATDVIARITPADFCDLEGLSRRAAALSGELGIPIAAGFEALVRKAERGIEDLYELTYIRKDGSRIPAVVSVTALRDEHEAIIGYLLMGTDGTTRKGVDPASTVTEARLDQQLRDQHFYTRALIDAGVGSLTTIDPRGDITDFNSKMLSLTGCTRAELLGAPFRDLFTDPDRADAVIARVLAEHEVRDLELTVRARSGKQTHVSYNAATFYDRHDKLLGVFAVAHDLTERRRIEEALQRKNLELEHAGRMGSEFLATMSHELRTPLNSVIGFSEALRDGLLGELTVSQREYVGDIFAGGQHLLELINDITDLSKVEAGVMELELEDADLSLLLSNSLSMVREKAAARYIAVDLELAEDLGVTCLDPRKIKQIVYNLLSNAVKFSNEGGRVLLRARRVPRGRVGVLDHAWPAHSFAPAHNDFDQFFEILVTDAGIGISEQNLGRLFAPFTQVDSGPSRRFEGTGLGLAMVKQLTELLGGTVAVASKKGEGTCFAAWIPLRSTAQPDTAHHGGSRARPTAAAPANSVALLVEDDDGAADLVRILLEAEGFIVLRARSAGEALQLAPQQHLDLITVDLQLPGIDGWEFLAAIRGDVHLGAVPVVIISGTEHGPLALDAGAAAVLRKPLSRAALTEALANLGFHDAQTQPCTVLVIDDDPQSVELIAAYLPSPPFSTVPAYGGQEAIGLAKRLLPDLIVLDLMMPDVSGFDVVHALRSDPGTAGIPVLIVTAKHLTVRERQILNTDPSNFMYLVQKAGFNGTDFMTEVRRARPRR